MNVKQFKLNNDIPIVVQVDSSVIMQPNDVDMVVAFAQTTQRHWIVAPR